MNVVLRWLQMMTTSSFARLSAPRAICVWRYTLGPVGTIGSNIYFLSQASHPFRTISSGWREWFERSGYAFRSVLLPAHRDVFFVFSCAFLIDRSRSFSDRLMKDYIERPRPFAVVRARLYVRFNQTNTIVFCPRRRFGRTSTIVSVCGVCLNRRPRSHLSFGCVLIERPRWSLFFS